MGGGSGKADMGGVWGNFCPGGWAVYCATICRSHSIGDMLGGKAGASGGVGARFQRRFKAGVGGDIVAASRNRLGRVRWGILPGRERRADHGGTAGNDRTAGIQVGANANRNTDRPTGNYAPGH